MAAEPPKSPLRKYAWVLALIAGFSGGSYMTLITFAASWVEMNSRPEAVVDAADLTPELLPLINVNQDEITDLWLVICTQHPEEC